jgi:fucose permease
MDVGALLSHVIGGGAGGAVLTLIIGAIKDMMGGRSTT